MAHRFRSLTQVPGLPTVLGLWQCGSLLQRPLPNHPDYADCSANGRPVFFPNAKK
jgi:hypothetical protein